MTPEPVLEHETPSEPPPRSPRSLLFPLLLIALGILLLLNNLGLLGLPRGEGWLRLWPLLLVLLGLDSAFNRGGVAGPSFLIGLGLILLAHNFGMLQVGFWRAVTYLWPLLLIAWGFDFVLPRRSIWLSLIGIVIVLGLLVGALILLSGRGLLLPWPGLGG